MKYIWSKRLASFLHLITLSFKRLFIAVLIVLFGTALLHIYTLINIVNKMAEVFRNNPNTILAIVFIIVSVPTAAYGLERSLNSYLHQK
jgi:hypothetical protein